MTCFLGIGVTCQLIMTCADVASSNFLRLRGSVAQCEAPLLSSTANIRNVPCKGALRLAFTEQGAQPSQVFYVVYILCLHGSVTACLLVLWVHIPQGSECCQVEVCAMG